MSITPEQLAAYADGELDEATARAVEQAVMASPDLQARVAAHRALRAQLSAHFAPVAAGPVPDRLARLLTPAPDEVPGATVISLAEARERRAAAPRRRWAWVVGPALAASLVLAVVGIGLRPSGNYADAPLASALDEQLAVSQTGSEPARVLVSFRSKDGSLCRGYAEAASTGIACRTARGWKLERQFGAGRQDSTQYRQAGSAAEQVFAAAQDMATGPAFDANEEAAAKARGWRAR